MGTQMAETANICKITLLNICASSEMPPVYTMLRCSFFMAHSTFPKIFFPHCTSDPERYLKGMGFLKGLLFCHLSR